MKPRVVALPGFLGRGSDWDQVRANSKCGVEWICANLFTPGAASFDPPELEGPCWLAGYSFGARLALRWMQDAPDDTAGIARALGDIARAQGMSQVARDAGLSRENLYRALSPEGNPSFATVAKVAKALGLRLHVQAAPGVA